MLKVSYACESHWQQTNTKILGKLNLEKVKLEKWILPCTAPWKWPTQNRSVRLVFKGQRPSNEAQPGITQSLSSLSSCTETLILACFLALSHLYPCNSVTTCSWLRQATNDPQVAPTCERASEEVQTQVPAWRSGGGPHRRRKVFQEHDTEVVWDDFTVHS